MTAVVTTYSMVSARPVTNPPHGPIAARENEYAPPVCGIAALISPMEKIIVKNITAMRRVAIKRPPQPVVLSPTFHPAKSPEMTAAMPIPQSPQKPAVRLRLRFSK